MQVSPRATATVATGLCAVLLTAAPLPTADAASRPSAGAPATAAVRTVPTVAVHMSDSAIRLSVGHRLRAGRVIFRVTSRQGNHNLQLLRLHRGYSLRQAGQDFGAAFGGNLRAIHRIDNNITFLGGASVTPDKPGKFSVKLHAGRLIAIDQNSNAFTRLRVWGTAPSRPVVRARAGITAFSYGFGTTRAALPRSGWTRVNNRSDQPHFIVMQRVKMSTTGRQVRRFIRSGARGNPPWGLKVNRSTGVISPNRGQVWHLDVPAGKYLLACFWPDDDTGMPHFFMGMWKLVRVR